MQSADFLSAVFFYLKVGENLNQNWIVENLNNAFSTWNGKLGELWGLVTTGPQTFKGGAVWSVMQTLHNGMVGIQSLGEQLKPVAMLSMLEYINTAVMSNERNDPKAATWVYFDEIYLLLRDSLSANFLYTSWKRFRKYNAYATGITQNVQDCLTNDTAYAMLANSEFVVMLRQTKDIDSVVELYGLSEPQRKYLLLAQPGEGIIKMGNSLIPFNNPQPKDTKTYKLLTTKPGEME